MIIKLFQIDIYNTHNNQLIYILYFRYGKGFGLLPKNSVFNIPNPLYGLAFYTLVAVLSMYSIIDVNLYARIYVLSYINEETFFSQVQLITTPVLLLLLPWEYFLIFYQYTWHIYYMYLIIFV